MSITKLLADFAIIFGIVLPLVKAREVKAAEK